jgi:hypothetical protein
VHLSDTPTRTVKKPPSVAKAASPELLRCLDKEKQGNCYPYSDDKDKLEDEHTPPRSLKLVKGIRNNISRGILKGYGPYVWESHDEAYAVFPPGNGMSELRQALEGRKIIIIGDSLNRQWAEALKCELQHVYGYDTVDVRFCHTYDFPSGRALKRCLSRATARDYVVFNFGHHQDPGKPAVGASWGQVYTAVSRLGLGTCPKVT